MAKNTKQIVTIEDFKVTNLAEFQGKKEQQEQLVKDNPYTEVVDTETYETAKKHRTALVTGRTSLDKEKKVVAKRIKEIIVEPVSQAYDDLILITKPHEDKQQEEVKRYEAKKEEERLEKQRLEDERIFKINKNIDLVCNVIFDQINALTYETSLTYSINPMFEDKEVTSGDFQEFGSRFNSEIEALKFQLEQRKSLLAAEEKNRLDAIELQKQQEDQSRKDALKQSIYNYQHFWNNKISTLTFDQIEATYTRLSSEEVLDYQEFQSDFTKTKEQITTSLNNRIKQLKQDREFENQQKEMLILQRRGTLAGLGFDYNTLTYANNGIELSVSVEELVQPEHIFISLIEATKQRIFEASHPVIQPEIEPSPEINDIVVKEGSVQNIEPETIEHRTEQPTEQWYTTRQLNSINFLTNFVAYCQANIGTTTEINIQNFVLNNVQ